jgi:LemA protein
MKGQTVLSLIIVLILIFSIVGIVLVINYNGIVSAEKAVEESNAQISAVLQRRLDLIPNLVEVVKGYAQYEKETLIAITKARAGAQDVLDEIGKKKSLSKEDMAELAVSQAQLSGNLKSIFALVENYPDLRANSNFLALQDQLEGTENRISVARQRYNFDVRIYNTKISLFPGNIIAGLFGFNEKIPFEAKEEAQEPVKVNF